MKLTQQEAKFAIEQLDGCKGSVTEAIYECGLTLRSLGHYRFRACEVALRWLTSIEANDDATRTKRIAQVRAIAEPAPAGAEGGAS